MSVQPQPVYGAQPQQVYGAQPQPVYGGQVIQQPQSQIVVQQPGANAKLVSSLEGHRTWSTDMFDCFSDERTSCLFTWIFPCATMAEVSKRLNENFLVACCVPGGMIALRARQRTLGGIKGSICGDYLSLCFCCVCSLGQMERELYAMGV